MKNLISLITISLIIFQASAQKIIEKQINTSANQVRVEFKFAEKIILKTWNKKEVSIKAEVKINEGELDDYFNLEINDGASFLEIKSNYGDLFEKNKSKQSYKNCNHPDIDAIYTLYIPKNYNLKVKSISGNVISEMYEGKLNVDIISGNIDIKKYNGELTLKTISGDIDVTVSQSKLLAETLTGLIYSDKDMQFDQRKNRMAGRKVTGSFGDLKNQLHLKTISGNIFIRK